MKLTESTLRKIIKEELSKIINKTHHSKDLNESITGNYWSDKAVMMSYFENVPTSNFDIVVGSIIFLLAATQAKEPLTTAFNMIKQYVNTNKIGKEKEQAALKVAQLVQKYKDNPELVQLVQQRKLNEFVSKLKELEGSSSVGKSAGADTYKGMKKNLGIPPRASK